MTAARRWALWGGLAALLAGAARPGLAQRVPAPVEVQFSLFFRILTYDRNLPQRTDDGLVICVVYQGRYRASVLVKDEVMRQRPPAGVTFDVRFVALDLDVEGEGSRGAAAAGCDVLYVAPLRAVDVATVAARAGGHGLLTLTGVPEYAELGLAIAVGLSSDRPEILVNLAASRTAGADLSAQLLRLATIR